MESPCLFQIFPTDSKITTLNCSPNQLLNMSSSSKGNLSHLKFFTTATSNKSSSSFLSNKKYREPETIHHTKNYQAVSSDTKKFKLNLLNHDLLHSYKHSLSNIPTTKNTYSLNKSSLNNSSINEVFPSSVKKNLMMKLQESHLSSSPKKGKNKVLFTTTTTNNQSNSSEEDLEELIDYIISSTKKYNRVSKNDSINTNNNKGISISISNTHTPNKTEEIVNGKNCKCKKVGCSKYSCNCLRHGLKCGKSCNCTHCSNQ